jgi:hypothetical protein
MTYLDDTAAVQGTHALCSGIHPNLVGSHWGLDDDKHQADGSLDNAVGGIVVGEDIPVAAEERAG